MNEKKEEDLNAKETYELWMEKLDNKDPLYQELEAIKDDENEITECFYQDIEFGTAGLRGICGAGTNRMNELTVGRATQGIANYILASGEDPKKGVVIAYDCRHHSKEFSEMAAEILAGNGIHAYIFPSLRPTPELSYAIRELGAIAGVNMTASHNPKEYNGYKVYWKDGAQISGEVSDGMLREIMKLDFFDEPKRLPLETAVEKGLATMLGEDMDDEYMNYILSLAQRPDSELDLTVPVVYTPLNGAGSIPMMEMAEKRGLRISPLSPSKRTRILISSRCPSRILRIQRPSSFPRKSAGSAGRKSLSRLTPIRTGWQSRSLMGRGAISPWMAIRPAASSLITLRRA